MKRRPGKSSKKRPGHLDCYIVSCIFVHNNTDSLLNLNLRCRVRSDPRYRPWGKRAGRHDDELAVAFCCFSTCIFVSVLELPDDRIPHGLSRFFKKKKKKRNPLHLYMKNLILIQDLRDTSLFGVSAEAWKGAARGKAGKDFNQDTADVYS